jgi:hypothetical protein
MRPVHAGKRSLDRSQKVQDKKSRNDTFIKRKRGILKKAIELSRLCDQRIFMFIYDIEKQRAIQFKSHDNFGPE